MLRTAKLSCVALLRPSQRGWLWQTTAAVCLGYYITTVGGASQHVLLLMHQQSYFSTVQACEVSVHRRVSALTII